MLQIESNYNEERTEIGEAFDYTLTDNDKICFTCSLSDCKPGKKCPREIAKSKK